MFANLMNREEKERFIELVYKIANCDQNYAEEEEELVNNYKVELGLTDISETDTMENIINYFSHKEVQLKKVVFFELYGMIMADGTIADKENEILIHLKESFALDEATYDKLANAVADLQKAYDTVYHNILEM